MGMGSSFVMTHNYSLLWHLVRRFAILLSEYWGVIFDMGILNEHFTLKTYNSQSWIALSDVMKYHSQKHQCTDKIGIPRSENLFRNFSKVPGGALTIDNKKYLNVRSVLCHTYKHVWELQSCALLAEDIERHIIGESNDEKNDDSMLNLYCDIASHPLKTNLVYEHFLKDVTFSSDPPTLYDIHKLEFTSDEWKKIVLFEHHFSQLHQDEFKSISEELASKRTFYHTCTETRNIAQTWIEASKQVIPLRKSRMALAMEADNAEIYSSKSKHKAAFIDAELQALLCRTYYDKILTVVCVDSEESKCRNGIHVYVESQGQGLDKGEAERIHRLISQYLCNQHDMQCLTLIIFKPGTFESYMRQDSVARFIFRDDLLCGKLSEGIEHKLVSSNMTSHSGIIEISLECSTCYPEGITKRLSLKTFDVLQEWHLDVPLVAQILLEVFLNKRSISETHTRNHMVQTKLKKLYTTYDMLLNIHNRNYSGLMQLANTDELVMHFKSAHSVFNVTSQSGATQSYSQAEKSLKARSVDDMCYFNTYLKEHSIKTRIGEESLAKVNLRHCHTIIMLDNLVRLKFRNDPEPGESRSQQICTLPLTIQGVSKSHPDVLLWHEPPCSASTSCDCKKMKHMEKEEFSIIT